MKREKQTKSRVSHHLMLMAGILLMLVAVSCKEDEVSNVSSETILEETAFAENLFSSIMLEVEDALPASFAINGRFGGGLGKFGCATRTVETPEGEEYPIVMTLDYGDSCDFWNGAVMSGKIITTISGPRNEVGTEIITTFEDFTVNDHQVEGTFQHIIISEAITSTTEESAITTPEGETFTRSSNRTREIVSGQDTEDRDDNVCHTSGASSGTTPDGVRYSKTITSPLVSSRDCRWITSGTIESTVDDVITIIDFGDGTCDNIATSTVDGETEEITMDFRVKRMYRHRRG